MTYNIENNMEKYTSDIESNERNQILDEKHKKLPSYCYWDGYSIEKESVEEKHTWWSTIETTKNKVLKDKWVEYYKKKL